MRPTEVKENPGKDSPKKGRKGKTDNDIRGKARPRKCIEMGKEKARRETELTISEIRIRLSLEGNRQTDS